MMKKLMITTLVVSMVLAGGVFSQVNAMTGQDLLENMDETMRVDNKYMEQEMVLVSSRGSERSREIATWSRVEAGNEQMLVRFLAPADVAGTGLLMEGDDMWLFLPELNNTRRIAGSARQGDFMGSDLSYEDMEALGTVGFSNDYQAELVEIVEFEGREAYKLELIPANDGVVYSNLEVKVNSEFWLPLKIDYYEAGELVKTLLTFDHAELDGRWTAKMLEMTDHDSGSQTRLILNEVDYNTEIDSGVFTTRNLERGL